MTTDYLLLITLERTQFYVYAARVTMRITTTAQTHVLAYVMNITHMHDIICVGYTY